MRKIDVTYLVNIEIFPDEEFGAVDSQDNYFTLRGLPASHISAFWKSVTNIPGCSRRPGKDCPHKDDRLRINWNEFYDYEDLLQAKEKILKIIRLLMPDAKVRYREFHHQPISDLGEADLDSMRDAMSGCALTEDECDTLGIDFYQHHANLASSY